MKLPVFVQDELPCSYGENLRVGEIYENIKECFGR